MATDLSLSIAIAPLVAFTVTLALVRYLIRSSGVLRILDHPNERSLHRNAVPRTGRLGNNVGYFGVLGIHTPRATVNNMDECLPAHRGIVC